MEILKGERGSGKTLELIRISHYTKQIIVCHTRVMKEIIKEMAIDFEYDIPEPILINDLEFEKSKDVNRFKNGILIDEIDLTLNRLLGLSVSCVTTSSKVRNIPLVRNKETIKKGVDSMV